MKNSMTNIMEDRFSAVKDSMRHFVDAGGERASAIKDSLIAGTKKTGSLIKEHPVIAIAVAFGVGYIAMRFMRR